MVIFRIPWTVIMTVLVLIPIFGYINCGQIWLVLNSRLRIMHTFLGSSKNVNYMDSGLPQHCDYCLDYICVFIVVTNILHTFIFHQPIFIQHTPVSSCNTTLFSIIWFCFPVVEFCSSDIMYFI